MNFVIIFRDATTSKTTRVFGPLDGPDPLVNLVAVGSVEPHEEFEIDELKTPAELYELQPARDLFK